MESWVEQLRTKLISNNEIQSLNTLDEYEPHIIEFFDELFSKDFLIVEEYPQDVGNRLKKLVNISNEACQLGDSFHTLYSQHNPDEIKCIEYLFRKLGFKTNQTHYIIAICQGYQVMSELLKKHLILFIDFKNMDFKDDPSKKSLGQLGSFLKGKFNGKEGKCKKNVFVDNLSVKIRNSIAHCTYYFEDNNIHFYDSIYDNKPEKMSVEQFRLKCNELNVLTQLVLIIYHDKYFPGGKLLLDKF